MKILHVLYAGLGGHGNVFFSMAGANKTNEYTFEALFYGIENVRNEYKFKCNDYNIKWYYAAKKMKLDIKYYWQLYRYMTVSKPDIIFLYGSSYILISKLYAIFSRRKCIVLVQETQANHLKTKREIFWSFWSLLIAEKVIFLTEEYKLQIKKYFKIVFNDKKTDVIPNGIDLDLYKPQQPVSSSYVNAGMQSRIVEIKDYETLIHAIKILSEGSSGLKFKLKIAGDGENKEVLQVLINKLELNNVIEFAGMLNEENLIPFLQGLDVYVHATLGETMSTAIMQAMACGKPIIASDVKGVNNMIYHNKNGLLVPPKKPNEMADAIYLLAVDKDLANRLAQNAHQTAVEKYSNKTMFEKYKKIFNHYR